MIIETKFNLGDIVYTIENTKVKNGEITAISFQVVKGDLEDNLSYSIRTDTDLIYAYKNSVFKTKKELISSL